MPSRDEFLRNLAARGESGLKLARILGSNALTTQKDEGEPIIHSLVFGFGHRARHGKDTVAKMIKEERGAQYDIRIYSFAAELKDEVNQNALASGGMKNLFGPDMVYTQTNGNFVSLPNWVQYEENPDMSDPLCPLGKQRTLLQWWGTEFRRSADPDYWVNKLAKRLAQDKPEIALITDTRFPNEVNFVRQYGDVIKVHRSSLPILPGGHPSEEALAHMKDCDWDAVIYNDGSLEDLKKQALYVFDELVEKVR